MAKEKESTATGVNKHIPEGGIVEEVPQVLDETLLPTEDESSEHRRVREVYIKFKKENPIQWENEKVVLFTKLSKL